MRNKVIDSYFFNLKLAFVVDSTNMLGLAQMRIDNDKEVTGFAIHIAGILHAVRNFRIARDLNEHN